MTSQQIGNPDDGRRATTERGGKSGSYPPQTPSILARRSPSLVRASGSSIHYTGNYFAENQVRLHRGFAGTRIRYGSPRLDSEAPTEHQYDTLKEQLTKRTAASKQRRLQQLFNEEELGDRKPSQLLRHMQQLLGDKASTTDGAFMRELFLQRLPANVRMVLASTPNTGNLEELAAQLADKIMEVVTPAVSSLNAVTELEQIRQEVAARVKNADAIYQTTQTESPQTYVKSSSTSIPWPETVTRSDLLVSCQVW